MGEGCVCEVVGLRENGICCCCTQQASPNREETAYCRDTRHNPIAEAWRVTDSEASSMDGDHPCNRC
jgi:hypothetical protein